MAHEIREATLNLYNPAAKNPEALLAEFVDRQDLLTRILDIVRHNVLNKPQQHIIVIGPRGMGKTTLLCAIRYSVQQDTVLGQDWLPLQFDEEQYGIGDLADFWLEALRHLEIKLKPDVSQVDVLLAENPDDLVQQAQDAFFALLAQSGKRALLLIDNINDLFATIDDGIALNQLRALWMTDARMMIVGASPSYFDEVTVVDQAFHDFFRIFHLNRLKQQELEDFLRRFAQIRGDQQVIQVIEQAPQRIAALRILTGGNPRLVMLGYRVLHEGFDGDVRSDFERLLDECTPFFKHRIETLAKEARRTFDAIARHWDPVTVDDIRTILRKPSNYVSAQIKRLIDEGFVEAISGEKKKRYQVSERLYNIYYLMRYSRESQRRLHWLIGFMQVFYTRQDYRYWAKRLSNELTQLLSESQRMEKLSLLQNMSVTADDEGRYAVFEAMVCDAILQNDRGELDKEIVKGDPVERYGFRYFALEIVWLLPLKFRQQLGFRPSTEGWWKKLRCISEEQKSLPEIERHLEKSEYWHMEAVYHATAIGDILDWFFVEPEKAEKAFNKAIKIDKRYIPAWNGMGVARHKQGRYKEAEYAYRKAIKLDEQFVFAWNNLGIVLSGQKRHSEAEQAFLRTIELDPQFASVKINLARIYLYFLDKTEEGIGLLVEGLSQDHDDKYSRYVLSEFWCEALPVAVRQITTKSGTQASGNLRKAITDTLLAKAAGGEYEAVHEALLALDEALQQPFEILILALQALDDRSVLEHIAREKRDVVLDVVASITPDENG